MLLPPRFVGSGRRIDNDWPRQEFPTVPGRFFHSPGKVVRHARSRVLPIAETVDSFRRLRTRSFAQAAAAF
jgi:hypothetical protein